MKTEDIIAQRIVKLEHKKVRRKMCVGIFFWVSLTVFLLRFVIGLSIVHGESMSPTLQDGDILLFDRITKKYQRDDIVIIKTEKLDVHIIKRIIGIPGDVIDIADGYVKCNGEEIKTKGVYDQTYPSKDIQYPLKLKEDEYFVLGDHRTDSIDSRVIGIIKQDELEGRSIFVFRKID